jgi:hypothetical protein
MVRDEYVRFGGHVDIEVKKKKKNSGSREAPA